MTLSLSLDHVGFMRADLDAGSACWQRLGFTLSPQSPQTGYDRATGRIAAWATANRCAILRRGYLELIGVVDPTRPNPWTHLMERGPGIHITALRCRDADSAWAVLRQRADGLDPPVDRRRQAPYGDGTREMRFRNIFSRDDVWPEGRFIVIEHQTPEVLWQEALMQHPNGAVGLAEVVLAGTGLAATEARLATLTGDAGRVSGCGERRFALPGGGVLSVLGPDAWERRFAGAAYPERACAVAAVVEVESLPELRRLLAGNGVPVATVGRELWVNAEQANGAVIAFREAI